MKKFFSAVFALATAITATTSAYAADVSTVSSLNEVDETINIGGYECYERDGQYWTIVDGEEFLFIYVDDFEDCEVCAPASLIDDDDNDVIPFPGDWTNSRVVYAPHNTKRDDWADISEGDYCSPLFRVFPASGDNGVNVKYQVKFYLQSNEKINMTSYMYNTTGKSWYSRNDTVYINSSTNPKVLFAGSLTSTAGAFAVRFHKNGSDNLSSFKYTFQVKLPFI